MSKVGESVDLGYHKVKIKIKPGSDVEYVSAVRAAYPDICLIAKTLFYSEFSPPMEPSFHPGSCWILIMHMNYRVMVTTY